MATTDVQLSVSESTWRARPTAEPTYAYEVAVAPVVSTPGVMRFGHNASWVAGIPIYVVRCGTSMRRRLGAGCTFSHQMFQN